MSAEITQSADTGHAHNHEEHLWHQFEDRGQQDESYIVGMWSFLVTEILFFGALFLCYTLFRMKYPDVWIDCHHELNPVMGGLNTVVLLFSSFTMAIAVWGAQTGRKWVTFWFIVITILCAFTFLYVKIQFEWIPKWEHHHVPGPHFHYTAHNGNIDTGKAMLFFGLYFRSIR